MKFEVVETGGEWIVSREGEELARFAAQEAALSDVAGRLREADAGQSAALCMRYERRP
ncbi:hypothetical protein [Phenylobacterium sp.]|uniref:hypothetical protein n=1 Tax=Phenylobacterium sp. TaxID=1871053 RepID=UPI0028117BE9|nr:hypothetical protein [Phenylobacterium sp.]